MFDGSLEAFDTPFPMETCMIINKKSLPSIVTVCATTCVLMVGVWLLLAKTVDKVVEKEARTTAIHWAGYFVAHLDNIETLITQGVTNQQQSAVIDRAVEFGEVFRFKIFRPDGTNSFVSDEYKHSQDEESIRVENEKALGVFSTGISNIAIKDGRQRANRPDVYVEAYVPVTGKSGARIGVAEVYIDQTEMMASLKDGFYWIALFLPVISALFFLLPALAMLRESATAKTAKAEAEELANFDALTGLYNRRSFNHSAETYFKGYRSIGTLFIDIDDFKRINDEHGHDGGDAFLRSVGQTLKSKLGEDAICSRFGGDEFVACVGDVMPDELRLIAQDILTSIAKGMSHRGQIIIGHVSIGLNIAGSDEPLSDMLHAADTALYKSKNEGKNTITFFSDDLSNELKRKQKLEKLLNKAVDGTGLEIFFQPINQPETKKILGFEALLRLRDEQGTMISPDEFIPLAERMRLIDDIGKWVLCEAVKTAKEWSKDTFISVNLSAIQFEQGDLPDFIKGLLSEHGFPAGRLEVEVTESLLIKDDGSAQKQLALIKSMGVSIAMDDFGTGYSSLGYLWKYGFDKLKIDRSFL
ncbi:MAG: diguanylate cyclase/phosphodiesterase (GGDEF & EAL domains) with PAS/PAC sensor(s), partial [uncultured Thiotrichaceae bacterium]